MIHVRKVLKTSPRFHIIMRVGMQVVWIWRARIGPDHCCWKVIPSVYFSVDLVSSTILLRGRYKGLFIVIPCHCECHKTPSFLFSQDYMEHCYDIVDKEIGFRLLYVLCRSLPPRNRKNSQVRQIRSFWLPDRVEYAYNNCESVPSKKNCLKCFYSTRIRT